MFKTALKLIFRNWWRNKTFTLISILSLTVGIACTALLISFVAYEYGIEKDNPNRDKLVWVMAEWPNNPGRKTAFMLTAHWAAAGTLMRFLSTLLPQVRLLGLTGMGRP